LGLVTDSFYGSLEIASALSPKEFARIIKFIGSLNYLKANFVGNLAEAAHSCGYYDQAHFIRDFKEFSGLTPSQFLTLDNLLLMSGLYITFELIQRTFPKN
jgi:methylphosphotriester-DNA--protein-cysteine methyltransferase